MNLTLRLIPHARLIRIAYVEILIPLIGSTILKAQSPGLIYEPANGTGKAWSYVRIFIS
jgi:hypothetical protein